LVGVSRGLLGVGWALVDACGGTDVGDPGPVEGLSRNTSMTTGAATAADATATSAIIACFVRYHGAGRGRNVNVLVFEARS
jgi:hypothetical protein